MSIGHIPSLNFRTPNLVISMPLALERDPLSRRHVFRLCLHSWNNGGTNCGRKGGSVFHIVFKRGEALPLNFVRIWRPRMSREVDAPSPRAGTSPRPRTEPVRDCGAATGMAHSRKEEKHGPAVDMCSPCPQSRQQTVHVRELAAGRSSRNQAAVTSVICPSSVRDHGMSASTDRPQPEAGRKSSATQTLPGQRLRVSMTPPTEFPVHIQHASAYDLI